MPFTAYIASELGTRSWAVGRATARMAERYDAVISPRRFAAIRNAWLGGRA